MCCWASQAQRQPTLAQATLAQAYLSGAYTMAEIGGHFGVHYMTVSRAVRKFEEDRKNVVMLELTPCAPSAKDISAQGQQTDHADQHAAKAGNDV
jgi:transposase-like protein